MHDRCRRNAAGPRRGHLLGTLPALTVTLTGVRLRRWTAAERPRSASHRSAGDISLLMPAPGRPAMLVARTEPAGSAAWLPNRKICEGARRSLLLAWQLSADERPVHRALFVVAAQSRRFVGCVVLADHIVRVAGCCRRRRICRRALGLDARRINGLDIRGCRLEAR